MSLSRDAVADWLRDNFQDDLEESRERWLEAADAFALQFKLPLDADGPGVTRCKCGHPMGLHREGENACRGTVVSGNVASACKCKKAHPAAL